MHINMRLWPQTLMTFGGGFAPKTLSSDMLKLNQLALRSA